MPSTARVFVAVAILAGSLAVYTVAQGGQSAAVRRLPPGVAAGGSHVARAVPRLGDPGQDGSFRPALGQPGGPTTSQNGVHPIVGSWFGKAIQVCPQGVAPSACGNGGQAVVLYMTPTLTPDGLFVADDSLTLLGPPFGPHTTAHGSWIANGTTGFIADYVFMSNPFPPKKDPHIAGLRARWVGEVISDTTAVGWVNAYFLSPTPVKWVPLEPDEFPVLPSEANAFVTPGGDFIKDPSLCPGEGCPLVFKFTIKRVTQ